MSEELQIIDSYYTTSATVGKLFTAIATAQLELGIAVKDGTNPDKGKKYATLASVIEASKVYAKNSVAIVQVPTANGSLVSVTTILAAGEEWLSSTLSIQAMRPIKDGKGAMEAVFDAQAIGGALSYLRRYALSAVALIAQDDDDGEKASKAAKEAAAQTKAEAEAASMFGAPASVDTPKAEAPKAASKTKEPKPPSALAQRRIDEETKKLESTKAGPPEGGQARLEWFMAKERTKYEHWDEFGRVKAELKELLGEDEGEMKYVDILSSVGANKANEIAKREDSVTAYMMMCKAVNDALAKPVEADPAKDDWLPEMKEQAA